MTEIDQLTGSGSAVDSRTGLRFAVLGGGVTVRCDDDDVRLGGPQQRRLLAALLAEVGATLSADRLVEAVWPEGNAPDGARRTVMSYVSRLRSALGGDHVVTNDHGYALVLGEASYDVIDFEQRLAAARESDGLDAIGRYDSALGLWSGRAFGDDGDEWWLRPTTTRLEELRLVAHEERAELLIRCGKHAEAVADLRALIAEQPLRERFIALEMRALYLSGRQAEALRSYRRFREYLADETGLDPSEELADLDHRITIGDPSLSPETGLALPGYELGEQIGEGAFGSVYRAVQPSVGRQVAIKAIRAELADDPRFVQRFEAEAQLVARLEHPHVVPLYDFWRRPGAAFLVFRLLRGGSLADRLADGAIELGEVVRVVEEIGGALATAHALGIVHRDVKPGNILFDDAGNSYLADFGIAVVDADIGDDETFRSAGSPLYASPEQVRDGVASASSDQYALAVVTWEALVGRAPFDGTTATELMRSKVAAPLPALPDGCDPGEAVVDVLRRATSPLPGDRYPDVSDFVTAFAAASAGRARATGDLAGVGSVERRHAETLAPMGAVVGNPYKGLRAFREVDAAEFHGRDALVRELVARTSDEPLVAVVGPSGSGKSSLVHAGAVPELRRRGAFVVSMIPGADPFAELDSALQRVVRTDGDRLRDRLRAPDGLLRIAADVAGDEPMVLVIDQFEELWTLVDDPKVRERFLASLVAATEPQRVIRIVVTMRADFYDRPLGHHLLGPVVRRSTFPVPEMTTSELHDAIVQPAVRVGVRFEPELVARMIADVISRPGALPLLQFALTELYDRRTDGVVDVAAYEELGGVAGALVRRAEDAYADLQPRHHDDVRRFFTQLVTPSDDSDDVRRRATHDELTNVSPTVIDRYLEHRLVVTDVHPITREPTLEVAHEALLREWPRLHSWIDADRDVIRTRRAIATAAREWEERDRDESALYRGGRLIDAIEATDGMPTTESEREFLAAGRELADRERAEAAARAEHQARQNIRLRRLLAATAVLLVAAVIAGLVAVWQRDRATEESDRARAAQADLLAANDEALSQRDRADVARVEAEDRRTEAEAARADAETARAAAERATDEALARGLAALSTDQLRLGRNDLAMLLAAGSQGFAAGMDDDATAVSEANDSTLAALGAEPLLAGYLEGQTGTAKVIRHSPDGSLTASIADDGDLRVWDSASRAPLPVTADPTVPYVLDLEIDDAGVLVLATAAFEAPVLLWDVRADEPWPWQPPYDGPILDLAAFGATALGSNGLLAVSASDAGYRNGPGNSVVDVWDIQAGERVGERVEIPGIVDALDFSPDGGHLAMSVVSPDGATISIQVATTADLVWGPSVVAHEARPSDPFRHLNQPFLARVVFSADGRRVSSVVSRSPTGVIATFDPATMELIEHSDTAAGLSVLAVSDDLARLVVASGSDDFGGRNDNVRPVQVMRVADGATLGEFTMRDSPGTAPPISFRPASTEIVFQKAGGTLAVLDPDQIGPIGMTEVDEPMVSSAEFAVTRPGEVGDLAAAVDALGPQRRPIGIPRYFPSTSGQVAIGIDGAMVIWDPDRDEEVRRLTGVPRECLTEIWENVSFVGSAFDGRIAAGCGDTLRSWDLGNPRSEPEWIQPWTGPQNVTVQAGVLLSADGTLLADHDLTGMRVLDARTGEMIAHGPIDFPDHVVSTAFSPDGSLLAKVHWSGKVELLDTSDMSHVRTFESRTGVVIATGLGGRSQVAVSPDLHHVATWHPHIGVEIWNARTAESVALLDARGVLVPSPPSDREVTIRIPGWGDYPNPAVQLNFSDDSTMLGFTAGQDFVRPDGSRYGRKVTVRWSFTAAAHVDAICHIVARDLDEQEWGRFVGAETPRRSICHT